MTEFDHADERIVVGAATRNLSEEKAAAAKEQREEMSCRSCKKTKMKRPVKEMMRSEDSERILQADQKMDKLKKR